MLESMKISSILTDVNCPLTVDVIALIVQSKEIVAYYYAGSPCYESVQNVTWLKRCFVAVALVDFEFRSVWLVSCCQEYWSLANWVDELPFTTYEIEILNCSRFELLVIDQKSEWSVHPQDDHCFWSSFWWPWFGDTHPQHLADFGLLKNSCHFCCLQYGAPLRGRTFYGMSCKWFLTILLWPRYPFHMWWNSCR